MLKNLLFNQSSFLKSTFSIAGGTAIGQLLLVASSPILTRLYDPTAMGMLGLFVSYIGLAGTAGTLRYEVAIVAASDDDALLLTKSCLTIAFFISVLSGITFEILRKEELFGYQVFPEWGAFLAALGTLGLVWGFTLRFYAIRKKAFNVIGRFVIFRAVFRSFLPMIFSILGGVGLFLGEAIAQILSLFSLRKLFPKRYGKWFDWNLLYRYKGYPLVLLPSALLDTAALMGLVPVFSHLYGTTVAGSVTLAQRLLSLPVALVGTAISDVFYGKASEIKRSNPKHLLSFFLKVFLYLSILSVILGILVWFLAPVAAGIIFGKSWGQTGLFMKIMAPWLAAQFAVSPLSRLIFLTPYSWLKLLYDILALIVILLPLFFHWKDSIFALQIVSYFQFILYIFYWIILFYIAYFLSK